MVLNKILFGTYSRIISILLRFLSFSLSLLFMENNNLIFHQEDLVILLDRAVSLFKETNLTELSEKCEKILKNYKLKKNLS